MNVYLWANEIDPQTLGSLNLEGIYKGGDVVWRSTPPGDTYELVASNGNYWSIWHNLTKQTFIISRHPKTDWDPDTWYQSSYQDYIEIADHDYWADPNYDYYLFLSDTSDNDGNPVKQYFWAEGTSVSLSSVTPPSWFHIPDMEERQYFYRLVMPILWWVNYYGWESISTWLSLLLNMKNDVSQSELITQYEQNHWNITAEVPGTFISSTKFPVYSYGSSTYSENYAILSWFAVSSGTSYTDRDITMNIRSSSSIPTWYVRLFKDIFPDKEIYAWCYSVESYPTIIHSNANSYPLDTHLLWIYEPTALVSSYNIMYFCRNFYAQTQPFDQRFYSHIAWRDYSTVSNAYNWNWYSADGSLDASLMWIWVEWSFDSSWQRVLVITLFNPNDKYTIPLDYQPSSSEQNTPKDWYLYLSLPIGGGAEITLSDWPLWSNSATIYINRARINTSSMYYNYIGYLFLSKFLWLVEKPRDTSGTDPHRNWNTAIMFYRWNPNTWYGQFTNWAFNNPQSYSPAWFDLMSTREDILYASMNR